MVTLLVVRERFLRKASGWIIPKECNKNTLSQGCFPYGRRNIKSQEMLSFKILALDTSQLSSAYSSSLTPTNRRRLCHPRKAKATTVGNKGAMELERKQFIRGGGNE